MGKGDERIAIIGVVYGQVPLNDRSMPSKNRETRGGVRIGVGIALIAVLSVFALWNAARYYGLPEYVSGIIARGFMRSRSIVRFEEQFACLREVLDPSEPVGFITFGPSSVAIEYFQLAQYTLSPVLLELNNRHPLVVGYFPSPDDRRAVLDAHPNLEVILDCNNEVALLGRRP